MKYKYNKSIFREIFILVSTLLLLVGGVFLDNGLSIFLPTYIVIESSFVNDIKMAVFSAQVSISTLGIALVAILGGVLKDEIYGINLTEYLTNRKALIFTNKRVIIFQLIAIFISYMCIAFNLYNTLVCIFSISIIMTILMVIDIFAVFKGNEYYLKDIEQYILNKFGKKELQKNGLLQSIIIGLKNDTLKNIDLKNTMIIKKNIRLFEELLKEITGFKVDEKKIILELFEDSFSDIFNKIFEEKDPQNIVIALNSMSQVYKICNDANKEASDNKTYIDIFENVFDRIFSAMAVLILSDREDQYKIVSMQYELYNNMNFKKIEDRLVPENNVYLRIYSGRIYYEMKRIGFDKYNKQSLYEMKKNLFTKLEMCIGYNLFSDFKEDKINQVYMQLYEYTKVLVDNNERELLKKLFFNKIDNIYYDSDSKKNEYIFIVLIYFYYLAEFEDLIGSSFKEEIKCLMRENQGSISHFLEAYYNITDFESDSVSKFKMVLGKWEKFPDEGIKSLLMDHVIEKFLLLYSLTQSWSTEKLINDLKTIVNGKELWVCSDVRENDSIVNQYISFNKLFYGRDILVEDSEEKINMLKYATEIVYKESELKRSSETIQSEEEFAIIRDKFNSKLSEKINWISNVFNKTDNEMKMYKVPYKLTLNTYVNFLEDEQIDQNISYTNDFIIHKFIKTIYNNIEKKDIENNDENMFINFFELYERVGIKTDTLIGYRDYFYRVKEKEKFKEFEESHLKIKSRSVSNFIVAVDSKRLYMNINNISVEIIKLDIEEVCSSLQKDEKGNYLYVVTNNIDIPFTKEELKIYLDNTRRKIEVTVDIEYAFKEESIGVGIFITK